LIPPAANPRLLVSSGEPSGDLYGAELVRHLRKRLPTVTVFGVGGDRLSEQGATLVAHVRDLAVVGIIEVIRHIPTIRQALRRVITEVDRRPPDAAVLIDYPDFNLRLAGELRARGVPTVYYVSPQVWAWKRGRIRKIRETVSHMAVIFPFEEALYRDAGVPVTYVGHPLVDLVHPDSDRHGYVSGLGLDPTKAVVAILPGSRPTEVAHNLPRLIEASRIIQRRRPGTQFVLAVAPLLDARAIEARCSGSPIRVVANQTHAVVGAADLALVASGTATVETALLATPMVVVYRVAPLTYALGRPFVRVAHFAMVNLIAGREVVPELIQSRFTPDRVASEALSLLEDAVRAERMREDLAEVRRRLGGPGASERAAGIVGRFIAARGGA
jgi:lipid-A-disaccharide synthase